MRTCQPIINLETVDRDQLKDQMGIINNFLIKDNKITAFVNNPNKDNRSLSKTHSMRTFKVTRHNNSMVTEDFLRTEVTAKPDSISVKFPGTNNHGIKISKIKIESKEKSFRCRHFIQRRKGESQRSLINRLILWWKVTTLAVTQFLNIYLWPYISQSMDQSTANHSQERKSQLKPISTMLQKTELKICTVGLFQTLRPVKKEQRSLMISQSVLIVLLLVMIGPNLTRAMQVQMDQESNQQVSRYGTKETGYFEQLGDALDKKLIWIYYFLGIFGCLFILKHSIMICHEIIKCSNSRKQYKMDYKTVALAVILLPVVFGEIDFNSPATEVPSPKCNNDYIYFSANEYGHISFFFEGVKDGKKFIAGALVARECRSDFVWLREWVMLPSWKKEKGEVLVNKTTIPSVTKLNYYDHQIFSKFEKMFEMLIFMKDHMNADIDYYDFKKQIVDEMSLVKVPSPITSLLLNQLTDKHYLDDKLFFNKIKIENLLGKHREGDLPLLESVAQRVIFKKKHQYKSHSKYQHLENIKKSMRNTFKSYDLQFDRFLAHDNFKKTIDEVDIPVENITLINGNNLYRSELVGICYQSDGKSFRTESSYAIYYNVKKISSNVFYIQGDRICQVYWTDGPPPTNYFWKHKSEPRLYPYSVSKEHHTLIEQYFCLNTDSYCNYINLPEEILKVCQKLDTIPMKGNQVEIRRFHCPIHFDHEKTNRPTFLSPCLEKNCEKRKNLLLYFGIFFGMIPLWFNLVKHLIINLINIILFFKKRFLRTGNGRKFFVISSFSSVRFDLRKASTLQKIRFYCKFYLFPFHIILQVIGFLILPFTIFKNKKLLIFPLSFWLATAEAQRFGLPDDSYPEHYCTMGRNESGYCNKWCDVYPEIPNCEEFFAASRVKRNVIGPNPVKRIQECTAITGLDLDSIKGFITKTGQIDELNFTGQKCTKVGCFNRNLYSSNIKILPCSRVIFKKVNNDICIVEVSNVKNQLNINQKYYWQSKRLVKIQEEGTCGHDLCSSSISKMNRNKCKDNCFEYWGNSNDDWRDSQNWKYPFWHFFGKKLNVNAVKNYYSPIEYSCDSEEGECYSPKYGAFSATKRDYFQLDYLEHSDKEYFCTYNEVRDINKEIGVDIVCNTNSKITKENYILKENIESRTFFGEKFVFNSKFDEFVSPKGLLICFQYRKTDEWSNHIYEITEREFIDYFGYWSENGLNYNGFDRTMSWNNEGLQDTNQNFESFEAKLNLKFKKIDKSDIRSYEAQIQEIINTQYVNKNEKLEEFSKQISEFTGQKVPFDKSSMYSIKVKAFEHRLSYGDLEIKYESNEEIINNEHLYKVDLKILSCEGVENLYNGVTVVFEKSQTPGGEIFSCTYGHLERACGEIILAPETHQEVKLSMGIIGSKVFLTQIKPFFVPNNIIELDCKTNFTLKDKIEVGWHVKEGIVSHEDYYGHSLLNQINDFIYSINPFKNLSLYLIIFLIILFIILSIKFYYIFTRILFYKKEK